MEAPPTAKRRRLNDALHKPFKSPLRQPLKPNANPSIASPLSRTPMNLNVDVVDDAENASVPAPTPIECKTGTPLNVATPTPKPAASSAQDPETISAIQASNKEIRRLESSAIRVRQDIDTLQQALSITQSTKSAELDALTQTWRQAARSAAEEVFAGARDKVNRMGGVGAWREREDERKNFGSAWDEQEVKNTDKDSDDEGEEGEEREGVEYERDERLQVVEDDWEYDREAQAEEKEKDVVLDDDSFTMDMMLKTMNIDLDLIGYDKHRQTWVG